jgi:hypothetical protein
MSRTKGAVSSNGANSTGFHSVGAAIPLQHDAPLDMRSAAIFGLFALRALIRTVSVRRGLAAIEGSSLASHYPSPAGAN